MKVSILRWAGLGLLVSAGLGLTALAALTRPGFSVWYNCFSGQAERMLSPSPQSK